MPLSKPFAIATEGPTIDGRSISRDWILQMASNYDPKVYTAVANLEHYLSSMPDSVFGAVGKVISLGTRETEILGEKKLQLTAVVDASDELVALQKKGKKAFSSMEVIANFIGKGIAYLGGLAFTDKPASLGTESMKFSVSGAEWERFTFGDEIEIEFEAAASTPSAGETLFAKVKNLLGLGKKETDERFADQGKAIEAIADSQKEIIDRFSTEVLEKFNAVERDIKPLHEQLAALDKLFTALKEKLGNTDGDDKRRGPATGNDGRIKPDC